MTDALAIISALRVASVRAVTVCGGAISLHVRGLTVRERLEVAERAKSGNPATTAEIVGMAACKADGSPLFTPEQVAELAAVDFVALEEIGRHVLEASGITAGAQDDAEKN